MKKYYLVIIHIVLIIALGIIGYLFANLKEKNFLLSKYTNEDNTLLSMMIENENGEYEENENNEWPGEGYILNTERSGCENGGTLEYQDNNVYVKAGSSDRCYVYFAIDTPENRCLLNYENGLACNIIKKYLNKEEKNLIYHDGKSDYEGMQNSNLEAGDLSYRYVGANPDNYICFGGDCSNDVNNVGYKYLYRIIGLFINDEEKYETKIIKADAATKEDLGDLTVNSSAYYSELPFESEYYRGKLKNNSTFYWNSTAGTSSDANNVNMWKESNLNKVNLNQYYYSNIDLTYRRMIEKHTWQVGGIPTFDGNAKMAYDYELGENKLTTNSIQCYNQGSSSIARACNEPNDLTYSANVGLLYANDYMYGTIPEYWIEKGLNYQNDEVKNNDWLYLGFVEWTISRQSSTRGYAWRIYYSGHFNNYNTTITARGVRPVVYLSSDVKITGGSGTDADPFKLGM